MSHYQPPANGDICQNPNCIKLRELYQNRRIKHLDKGNDLFEAFLDQEDAPAKFYMTKHANMRSVDRCVNTSTLFDEVVKEGYVIDFNPKTNVIIVKGSVKLGPKQYRTFHVPMAAVQTGKDIHVKVLTVFDPKASSHLYDKSLNERVCWCQPHELDEFEDKKDLL